MKSFICMIAAGLFLLPAWGVSAEKKDIHEVMTAQEHHGSTAPAEAHTRARTSDEESVLDEEMDELGDEPVGSGAAAATAHPTDEGTVKKDAVVEQSAPQDGGHGIGIAPVASDDAAYGAATAIEPVTLADGDWVFIEGDERRGWFFDRAKMQRNSDGSISYWQLILYNDLGKAQFVNAMHDEAYRNVGYTLQRRVLDTKKNTIRTYEIIAYDAENTVITDSSRDGHAAEIRPHTMAAKERDAVKKAAKKRNIKNKSHT
ncbi:hypothetical protein HMPREF9334_00976 [Selenomonas infelix ATCC 43532]|uniref:Uncharacterized protein n=1 Tax=Selenomonas infelix ATCC 43532 TaxID=679201 RepID=G5GNM2_9FIRM|nr:hypothetical protein [Selenomonas infelix]EHG21559.1 hypothetical protein HMPREF9334_00976 [Selenomonas infelix ATCC 43532]